MGSINADTYRKLDGAAQDLKNKTPDKVSSVEDQLEKYGKDPIKKVESMASSSFDMARDYVKSGREFVMLNPTKGIAIAAATGLVAGGLLAFAFRKRH